MGHKLWSKLWTTLKNHTIDWKSISKTFLTESQTREQNRSSHFEKISKLKKWFWITCNVHAHNNDIYSSLSGILVKYELLKVLQILLFTWNNLLSGKCTVVIMIWHFDQVFWPDHLTIFVKLNENFITNFCCGPVRVWRSDHSYKKCIKSERRLGLFLSNTLMLLYNPLSYKL